MSPPTPLIPTNAEDGDRHSSLATTAHGSFNLAAGVYAFSLARPSSPALVLDSASYSYAQLAEAARRVARWLGATAPEDVTPEDVAPEDVAPENGAPEDSAAGRRHPPGRVGVLASRSLETYAGILGAAWAGDTAVPLNPKQPPARLASILKRARLCALVVDHNGAHHLENDAVRAVLPARVLVADRHPAVPLAPATLFAPQDVPASHPAYVLFTSGTTGVPKGVEVCVDSVAHFLARMRDLYGIHPGDRVGQFGEASFDLSVFEIFAAWDGGAALHVVPESKLMAPAGFIRQRELTVWTSVPSVISILSRMKMLEAGSFPSLRVSFFIGEALPIVLADAWHKAAPQSVVDNHYGPTEATVACTMQRWTSPPVETPERGTLAIGHAYDGLAVEAVSAERHFLGAGEIGELAIHGPQLATGYFDDPEQTRERFPTLDHPQLGRGRWYLTGDCGFRDDAGVLHCLGRIDHQVKVGGHRVELEDIEAHLRTTSGTDAVAALAWPRHHGQATGIVAFVCNAIATPAEIRERMRALVPPYMVPRKVVVLGALPLSVNGKVDRNALESLAKGAA